MQQDLFANNNRLHIIPISHGELWYFPNWLSPQEADNYLSRLLTETAWEQTELKLAGKLIPIPRLNAWYGDVGTAYTYSGHRFTPRPFTRCITELKTRVMAECAQHFAMPPLAINSALLNQYRDGADSVAWHADDEDELGDSPQIVSLSFGETRRFLLKPKPSQQRSIRLSQRSSRGSSQHPSQEHSQDPSQYLSQHPIKQATPSQPIELSLQHGSLLLMLGDIQKYWLHSVPKTKRFSKMRVNITFREVINKTV